MIGACMQAKPKEETVSCGVIWYPAMMSTNECLNAVRNWREYLQMLSL
jgi:hypothetical protein